MTQSTRTPNPLDAEELRLINAWWRACNYLSVGMIYLRDNPLLKEPLKIEHVKHRLLGHWGASPALSFTWAHLNRIIISRGYRSFSSNSLFRDRLALTLPLRLPVPFMRAVNSGTVFPMLTALVWTIQTLSLPAWWEMEKPKPGRLQLPGIPINSSILSVMGRYCPY